MAITVMGITRKTNKDCLLNCYIGSLAIWMVTSTSAFAGDWQFKPSFDLDETYTDNVELTSLDKTSSFVTQTIAGLEAEYNSNLASFQLSGTQVYALYSHNSSLNDSFRTLNTNGQYSFWRAGPALTFSATVANINQNNAQNGLADLISSDTIEQKTYSTGLQYNFGNSSYSVTSSINYNIIRNEDSIGDSNGFTARFGSENGSNARHIYWQLDGNYTKRDQQQSNNDGENHTIEALFGAITTWNLNPFVRYYDENVQGTGVNSNIDTTSSWGPGVRWLATPHIVIDLSYNFVDDETISDNYVDTSIEWEPSARTSLIIGYSQRFFGDSYSVDFNHKIRRLTNSISYDESLEVFDRSSYREIAPNVLELIESDEFSLNKRFAWSSQLQLSRTSFNLAVSANERKSLETNVVDDTFDANISVTRTNSQKSSVSLSAAFSNSIYDKNNPLGSTQEDYYRTISANFRKNLASSLSWDFTVRHVNRNSTVERLSYNEVRAIINITKEF